MALREALVKEHQWTKGSSHPSQRSGDAMGKTMRAEVSEPKFRPSRGARRALRRAARQQVQPEVVHACPQCGYVYDEEGREDSVSITLKEGKDGRFCSSACVIAFAQSEAGATQILFRPLFEACFAPSHGSPWAYGHECRCIQCEKGSELQWGNTNTEDEGTEEEIRELKLLVHKANEQGAFKDRDHLGRKLVTLLGERIPAYREQYLEIGGGYGSLVDGVYLLCSLECLIKRAEAEPDWTCRRTSSSANISTPAVEDNVTPAEESPTPTDDTERTARLAALDAELRRVRKEENRRDAPLIARAEACWDEELGTGEADPDDEPDE